MAPLAFALGCPFWSFAAWNGGLYTADARPGDRLRQYARVFNAVEGNTTFYSAPIETTARRWAEEVPPGFRFCFKLPREITHDRLLRGAGAATAAFVAALAPLSDHLGPLLVQLPPAFGPDRLGDLEAFLDALPAPLPVAVELRHRAFFEVEALAGHLDELLAKRGCDRVVMDTRALRAGNPRHPEVIAALHRKPDLPVRPTPIGARPVVRFVGHPDAAPNERYLDEWSERLAEWIRAGLDPFFFVHTASNLHTPEVARAFHARVAAQTEAGTLPAFPGERGETAEGQLALLPLGQG